MSTVTLVIAALTSLCCCLGFFFLLLAVVGFLVLRKRGKGKVSVQEAVQAGADVSRAFIRGEKTREQLLAEEDEAEARKPR